MISTPVRIRQAWRHGFWVGIATAVIVGICLGLMGFL